MLSTHEETDTSLSHGKSKLPPLVKRRVMRAMRDGANWAGEIVDATGMRRDMVYRCLRQMLASNECHIVRNQTTPVGRSRNIYALGPEPVGMNVEPHVTLNEARYRAILPYLPATSEVIGDILGLADGPKRSFAEWLLDTKRCYVLAWVKDDGGYVHRVYASGDFPDAKRVVVNLDDAEETIAYMLSEFQKGHFDAEPLKKAKRVMRKLKVVEDVQEKARPLSAMGHAERRRVRMIRSVSRAAALPSAFKTVWVGGRYPAS